MACPRLHMRQVRLAHGSRVPLHATLRPAALTALMGPNGVGKSTLIRTLAGLSAPAAGVVLLDQQPLSAWPRTTLAQTAALVLTDTVANVPTSISEFVALGRIPHTGWWRRMQAHDRAAVTAALTAVGLGPLAARALNTLSDGERQRAAIARAIAQDTPVLMLDEAIAFLDVPGKLAVLDLLRTLAHEQGRAVLLATHDLEFAREFADELWLLQHNAPMLIGAPEQLALSGELACLFAGAPVRFDAAGGGVRLRERPPRAWVALSGSEPARAWTLHALRRVGIDHDPSAARRITATTEPAPQWLLQAGAVVEPFAQLADLIAALLQQPDA